MASNARPCAGANRSMRTCWRRSALCPSLTPTRLLAARRPELLGVVCRKPRRGGLSLGSSPLRPSRQKLLGQKFGGVLVADAFASYNKVEPKDRQSCLSHIKTKAKELEQELALLTETAADPKARQFCQDIQGWVHDACQAHHRMTARPWRAQPAQAQARKLEKQLGQLCRQPLRYPKAEKLRQRLLGPQQPQFFTCFRRPGSLPPTTKPNRVCVRW